MSTKNTGEWKPWYWIVMIVATIICFALSQKVLVDF